MVPRNMIMRMLFAILIILVISTGVQAEKPKEVNASDILKQIENGDNIYLNNVYIIGELNLSKIRIKTVPIERKSVAWVLPSNEILSLGHELKIVESKIYIENSVFKDNVDFSNAQFKYLLIMNTSFSSNADFKGDNFGDVSFRDSNFNGNTYFWNANFSGDIADFEKVTFRGFTFFEDANFIGYSDFRDANFPGFTIFGDASFNGDTTFEDTRFSGVTFKGARFNGAVYFVNANFISDAYFTEAIFKSDGKFSGTKFTKVNFNDVNFDNVDISWSSLKNALTYDGRTYVKLIKHFKDFEQFDDADDAYYQYRQLSQANKNGFSWVADEIWRISCGYGVKPENTILLGVLIMLVFSLIYWQDKNPSIENAFYFSIATFVSAQSKDWHPEDRYRKIAYAIERLLGVLILSLFVVTLTKVMIRP
jgi:hypothetical protein